MVAVSQTASRTRPAIYVAAALGVVAWGIPLNIIAGLFSGADSSIFGTLVRLSNVPPYGRIAVLATGTLFSLLVPLWLMWRGQGSWALASAILSLAIAFLIIYLPATIAIAQAGQ